MLLVVLSVSNELQVRGVVFWVKLRQIACVDVTLMRALLGSSATAHPLWPSVGGGPLPALAPVPLLLPLVACELATCHPAPADDRSRAEPISHVAWWGSMA